MVKTVYLSSKLNIYEHDVELTEQETNNLISNIDNKSKYIEELYKIIKFNLKSKGKATSLRYFIFDDYKTNIQYILFGFIEPTKIINKINRHTTPFYFIADDFYGDCCIIITNNNSINIDNFSDTNLSNYKQIIKSKNISLFEGTPILKEISDTSTENTGFGSIFSTSFDNKKKKTKTLSEKKTTKKVTNMDENTDESEDEEELLSEEENNPFNNDDDDDEYNEDSFNDNDIEKIDDDDDENNNNTHECEEDEETCDAIVDEDTEEIDNIREKVRLLFKKSQLKDNEYILELERGIYDYSTQYCEQHNIIQKNVNKKFIDVYINKSRSLFANLSINTHVNNNTLLDRLKSNEITPYNLSFINFIEIFPENWKTLLDEKHNYEKSLCASNKGIVTNQFKCGRCKQKECEYYELQTRSADEAMTIFISCLNCGKRWKQ